jgi:hypothetical protein
MISIFYNKNGWSRWTVSTFFYLFVAFHDARSRWLVLDLLPLRECYLPEPRSIILYPDEALLVDASDDCCQFIRCPLEVDEEDLEWASGLVIRLVESRHIVNLIIVNDVVEDLGDLLRRATIKSIADAERRNGNS